MKDDIETNIKFASLIELHPCLYDYTSSEYSKRNVQDSTWEKIAKEISESVQDCKERWKNLRTCYSRHLKSLSGTSESAAKAKRPYYLAEHLHFLQPFTKSRKSKGNTSIPQSQISSPEQSEETKYITTNDSDHDPHESLPGQDTCSNVAGNTPLEDQDFATPISKYIYKYRHASVSMSDVNKAALEYFVSRKISKEKKTETPDLDFFKSLLPDMNEMNNDQKRRFKIGILNLAGQILSESTPTALPHIPTPSSKPPLL